MFSAVLSRTSSILTLGLAVQVITLVYPAGAQPLDGRNGPGLWGATDWCNVGDGGEPEGNYVVNTWPGGVLPYRFNANVTPQNQQHAIDAMAEIEGVCDADFIPWTGQTAYLFINNHPSQNNSCVGYSGGVCTVNIHEWESKGVIVHELGHSLGLWHEQQRPDRNSYVQVNVANICSGAGNFSITGIPFGPYDFESIMHYPRRSNSRDGSETISVLPAYAEWKYYCGQYHHLSNGDIWVLTQLYGGPRPPRTFALVSPAHRAQVGVAWVPSFVWGSAELADSYHLQVDDDPYFASPEIDVNVTGTTHTAGAPLPDGQAYFWRVMAVDATGETEARPRPVHSFLTETMTPSFLYVDDSAAPGGTGASWASAMRDLGDALALADCSAGQVGEVRVGQGEYRPDRGTGDRDGTFSLAGGVQVKGGYAGVGAPDPDARDASLYPTVLTGDLASDDQPGFVNYEENSRRVVSAIGVAPACTLDGLTITAGNADGVLFQRGGSGGGVYSRDSHVILKDCRVTLCSAYIAGGGAQSHDGGSIEATGTLFESNRTTWPVGGGGAGAGLNTGGESAVTLIGCTFRANTGFQGAGANITDLGPGLIRDCVFEDNVADEWAGGLQTYRKQVLSIDRCVFSGNIANAVDPFGGYAGAFGNYGLTSCGVGCVSTLTNCLFDGNSAAWTGGAINNDDSGTTTVVNCTIVGNTAAPGRGGGIANTSDFGGSNVMIVRNAIARANTGSQIVNIGAASFTTVTYSNVQGGFAGTGNLNADPLFADPSGGDYSLTAGSPCIDAGNNSAVPVGITADLDGNPRFVDDPAVVDTGVGTPPIVDMGAFERQVLLTIVAANPPAAAANPYAPGQPFRDVLDTGTGSTLTAGIGGAGTAPQGGIEYAQISVTFSAVPSTMPSAASVTLSCTGGNCPSITSVTGSGAGPYALTLSGVIPARQCATLTFAGAAPGQKLQYQSLPGDVNLDGTSNTIDLLALVQALNAGAANQPQNLARYNLDRSTGPSPVNTSDLLRLVQLLNGVNTTQAFNGATVASCP